MKIKRMNAGSGSPSRELEGNMWKSKHQPIFSLLLLALHVYLSTDQMNKDPNLIIHTANPCNAEPPLDALRKNFITGQELFYVRNHGDIPEIDPGKYRLRINGMVEHELELSLETIQ